MLESLSIRLEQSGFDESLDQRAEIVLAPEFPLLDGIESIGDNFLSIETSFF